MLYRSADVSDEKTTGVAIQELAEALGGIDILINCAGILREGYFEDLPLSDFQNVMNVNVYGVISATRAALPFLKHSQGRYRQYCLHSRFIRCLWICPILHRQIRVGGLERDTAF